MVVVILIFGLFVSACSYQVSSDAPVINSCSGATDCQVGETCYEGICVSQTTQPLEVTLEIAPTYNEVSPSNESKEEDSADSRETGEIEPAVVIVPPFHVTGLEKQPRRFELPLLVEVSGTIRKSDARVPAKITFIPIARPDDINATRTISAITVDQTTLTYEGTLSDLEDSEGNPSDFVTHVLQNVYYNVLVQPSEDSELPPFIYREFRATKYTVTRIPPIDYDTIDFTHRWFTLSLPDIRSDFSLDIFAVSSDDPNLLVSSWHTIADIWDLGGSFDLNFFPQIDLFDLIISPVKRLVDRSESPSSEFADESQAPIWPIFTIGFDLENDAKSSVDSEAAQSDDGTVEIKLPAVDEPVTFTGYVDLCEASLTGPNSTDSSDFSNQGSNTGLPISFYSKELSVNDDDQTGITSSYSTRTNTVREPVTGELKFAVDILPGIYEVVVSPPLDNPCEVYAKEVTITGDSPTEIRFRLAAKTYLRGSLKTVSGEPVFGATIQAQALNRDGIDQSEDPMITRFNRSNQTTTDENGRYKLPVDLGSYDIIAKPPVGSHYGWKVITDVAIDQRGGPFDRDFVFDAPVPVEGILSYANKPNTSISLSGLEGAEVRVFAVIRDIDGDAETKRTVAIGRVTADQQSSFTALISVPQESDL